MKSINFSARSRFFVPIKDAGKLDLAEAHPVSHNGSGREFIERGGGKEPLPRQDW